MISSLTIGIAAASFVPLALACLHLTRNKLLFFSASLAVFIHLSPSLSFSLPRPLAVGPTPTLPLSCLHSSISFSQESSSFSFRSQTTCNLVKFSDLNALMLSNGSLVTIIGDSQSRLLTLSLLDLLLVDPTAVHDALFCRHSDYHLHIPFHSITVSFLWAPFEANISHALTSLNNDNYPDVIVAGSGLWHMLHVTNPTLYGENLVTIRDSAKRVEKDSNSNSHLFWLGLPALVTAMLNTDEKRARMNGTMQELYSEEVEGSGLLRRDDDGPFLLLDVGELSRGCGRRCTVDGMHYDKVVYDAAVQIMLNALLIETRQGI